MLYPFNSQWALSLPVTTAMPVCPLDVVVRERLNLINGLQEAPGVNAEATSQRHCLWGEFSSTWRWQVLGGNPCSSRDLMSVDVLQHGVEPCWWLMVTADGVCSDSNSLLSCRLWRKPCTTLKIWSLWQPVAVAGLLQNPAKFPAMFKLFVIGGPNQTSISISSPNPISFQVSTDLSRIVFEEYQAFRQCSNHVWKVI
jgi:hypothetical protein